MVVAHDRVVVGALMHLCIHISAVFVLETNCKTTTSSTLVVVVFVVIGAPELQRCSTLSKKTEGRETKEVGVKLLRNNNTRRRPR